MGGNIKIISLFLNSNRKIDLDIQSTDRYHGHLAGTTGYHILEEKKITINVAKEKISKNQKLIFSVADEDLSELKKLLQIKKFKII